MPEYNGTFVGSLESDLNFNYTEKNSLRVAVPTPRFSPGVGTATRRLGKELVLSGQKIS